MLATSSLATRRALFWLGFFLAFGLIVVTLGDVLVPFVLGMAIAYLMNPLCEALSSRGLPRTLATLFVLFLFAIAVLAIVALLVPMFAHQISGLATALPGYVDRLRDTLQPQLQAVLAHLSPEDFARLREAVGQYAGKAAQAALSVAAHIWSGGAALINIIALLLITPIVAFYLLRDWPLIVTRIQSWLPRSKAQIILTQIKAIDRTLAGFLRGQSMVCTLLAAYYAIGLTLVGLDFGIAVGVVAGLLSFIPFVGSTFGLVAATSLALVQFDSYTPVAIVVGIFMLAQFLEGNVIAPKLIGESVGLHPVWIIFALMAGGALFGFIGLLLAIPVAAVLGVLVRFALQEYLDSPYYRGGAERRPRKIRPL